MLLDLGLLIVLTIGFFIGLRRGFILQLIHLVGFIISFIVAYIYYDRLAPKLVLWVPYPDFDPGKTITMLLGDMSFSDAYYRAIAFVLIFIVVRVVLGIIGSALDFVASLPLVRTLNVWAGGFLGLIETYLYIFIILYIMALLPIASIQQALGDSLVANGMIKHTPILSSEVKKWWIDYIQS